jgi:hypothetical protein
MDGATATETPWYAAFPPPKTAAPSVCRSEVLGWLGKEGGQEAVVDFVLIDLRRADYEVSSLV